MSLENILSEDSLTETLFLKQLLEKLPVGIQVFDVNGLTAFMNQKQVELLGIKDVNIALGKFNVLTDPYSIANGSAEFYKQVYQNKNTINRDFKADFGIEENEWETTRALRYFHEYVFPVLDVKGNISKVIAVLYDYTEDELGKEIIYENEQRFRSIFENAVSGIAFTDADGNIILVNKAFQEIVGYNSDELAMLKFSDITYKEDLSKEAKLMNCAIESKSDNCRLEKRYVKKNGDLVWVDVSIGVIRDKNETPLYFVAILHDITQNKQAEEELSKALQFNQGIIDTSPVGITSVNESGQITFANKRAELLLGLQKKDITQLSYKAPEWKITDIDGGPFPEKKLPFAIVQKTKEAINNVHHAIEWPNGKRVCLSINATPQLDASGKFIGMVATFEDITQKLAIENQIKKKNAFLNAIISNAAEGLFVCHACNDFPFVNFTVWNDKMTKITGYTMEEINELGWYQTLYQDPEIREMAMQRMVNMRQEDDIANEEWLITRKDKQPCNISIATSIISVHGDEVNVMALINDVTEKHKAKIAIEEANKKLKELNDSKDRFFEILAHDLKGPLGASLSLSQNLVEKLNKEDSENDTTKFVGYIFESVQRSFNLLEDLLDWSQAQTHKADFNPKKILLAKFVQRTINSLTDIATNKGVGLDFDIKTDIEIVADDNMIRTILRNLINNAIKYSYSDGKINIKVEKGANETTISVSDNGIGIDEEHLSYLFKIDKNISTKGTNNEKGTGLGLLLCKELVEYHKGKIWATSTPGKGTTFSFSIPVN